MQLVSLVWNFDNPFANCETHVNLTNALTAVDSNITYLASDEGIFQLSVIDDSLSPIVVPGAGTPAFLMAKNGYVIVGYDTKVVSWQRDPLAVNSSLFFVGVGGVHRVAGRYGGRCGGSAIRHGFRVNAVSCARPRRVLNY